MDGLATRNVWPGLLLALVLAMGLVGCAATGATRSEVTSHSEDSATRSFRYADGSGNLYVFEGDRLRYEPVTPATSSSGTYSGGAAFERTLSREEADELARVFDAALAATGSHTRDRVMGSGLVSVERAGQRDSRILSPGCAEQKAVEALLAKLKPRGA